MKDNVIPMHQLRSAKRKGASVNVYEEANRLGRPLLVDQAAKTAVEAARVVLASTTSNTYRIKAWAAVAVLQRHVPKILRHGGLALNTAWAPRTMKDYDKEHADE